MSFVDNNNNNNNNNNKKKKKKNTQYLCRTFGSPYLGKEQQPQEQRYPFLPGC